MLQRTTLAALALVAGLVTGCGDGSPTEEDLDDDATEEEINKIGDDLSTTEEKRLDAFESYATNTCSTTPEGTP